MTAYTRRRLLASAKLGLASLTLIVLLWLARGDVLVPGTFLLGFGLGFAVGLAELFVLKRWFRAFPFVVHVALKSATLLGVLYATFAVLNLLDVVLSGISWAEWWAVLTSRAVLVGLAQAFAVIVFLLAFVHLDRLLGPGVLLGYVTGRYHRPRTEDRIFMFLDLVDSTGLAERMSGERYFEFLHRYFAEMSEPVLESGAEVYAYVGDEVVLTWPMAAGLGDADCVQVFFRIADRLAEVRDEFVASYGFAPAFKAGVHAGEVITAQIGELKKEVVYSGDVLNTTARIQAQCNALDRRLLASAAVVGRLELGPELTASPLGPVALRGKAEAVELYAIERTEISAVAR